MTTIAAKRVVVDRKVGDKDEQFIFVGATSAEATTQLDELLSKNATADHIRTELAKYIVKAGAAEPKKNISAAKKTTKTADAEKKTTRGRGESNDKRKKVLEFFDNAAKAAGGKAKLIADEDAVTKLLKDTQKEFGITYANAYYYYGRVWNA